MPFSAYSSEKVTKSIGSIKMLEDKSIVLVLRAESEDGAIGSAKFIHKPNDPEYRKILNHVGGLKVGEEKSVPPWK